jgi:hypothetical protein
MRKKLAKSDWGIISPGSQTISPSSIECETMGLHRKQLFPSIGKHLMLIYLGICCSVPRRAFSEDAFSAGPLYDRFSLTLSPGNRTEILGPCFYSQQKESQHLWAIPPLTLSHLEDSATDYEEFDFAYPVVTYVRFGEEYRWQFFQLFNLAGGRDLDKNSTHRFSLFPIYFQQRSTDPGQNYTAVFPIYGELKHRFFRDEIDFTLFPLYSKTRKKDVVTYNMPYPFFHLRHGDGLQGWQLLPLAGHEHKEVTSRTNGFGETQVVGGHDDSFIMWPFFTRATNGIGTDNVVAQQGLLPFYSLYRSKLRDSTSFGWPLGVTHTVDREKKYEEWDAPWPLVEFAHGEGKTEKRVWPFYSRAKNQFLEAGWYLWPVYKYNRVTSAPLDRERTRILFFLYSRVNERNSDTGRAFQRTDFMPLFTHRRDFNGNERLQILSILEPIFPTNETIERDYGPLYSLWRSEKNPRTGEASQSLLWNLYRREVTPHSKKISLLLGLFQYQTGIEGARWRVCYIPIGHGRKPLPGLSSRK